MKGNEARVVFFLHPVDQLKDGQVSKVQPLRSLFAVTVLLLLGLIHGLGVLVFVLLQFGVETRSQQESVSTPDLPFDATTKSPETKRTRKPVSFDTIDQSRGNDSPTETELPTEIIQPGITYDTILFHKSK